MILYFLGVFLLLAMNNMKILENMIHTFLIICDSAEYSFLLKCAKMS